MQFWMTKIALIRSESQSRCLLSRCYCVDAACLSIVIFATSPHFMGASCARPCIFPVIYRQAAPQIV